MQIKCECTDFLLQLWKILQSSVTLGCGALQVRVPGGDERSSVQGLLPNFHGVRVGLASPPPPVHASHSLPPPLIRPKTSNRRAYSLLRASRAHAKEPRHLAHVNACRASCGRWRALAGGGGRGRRGEGEGGAQRDVARRVLARHPCANGPQGDSLAVLKNSSFSNEMSVILLPLSPTNISLHAFFSLAPQGVGVMLDLCGRSWDETSAGHPCLARASWSRHEEEVGEWAPSGPLQVGGLAHPPPLPQDHGWVHSAKAFPFEGCVSHIAVNGQVRSPPLPRPPLSGRPVRLPRFGALAHFEL